MTPTAYFILSYILVLALGIFIGMGLMCLGGWIEKRRDNRVARKVNRELPWH